MHDYVLYIYTPHLLLTYQLVKDLWFRILISTSRVIDTLTSNYCRRSIHHKPCWNKWRWPPLLPSTSLLHSGMMGRMPCNFTPILTFSLSIGELQWGKRLWGESLPWTVFMWYVSCISSLLLTEHYHMISGLSGPDLFVSGIVFVEHAWIRFTHTIYGRNNMMLLFGTKVRIWITHWPWIQLFLASSCI